MVDFLHRSESCSAVVVAALAVTAAFGCGDRTTMVAGPEDETQAVGPGTGGLGGASSQTNSGTGGNAGGLGGEGGTSVRADPGAYSVAAGGYVTSGPWHGYAWTATDSSPYTTIIPSEFSGLGEGGPLCVKGVVSDQGLEIYSILGINVAQPQDSGWADVWNPSGSGLAYSLLVNLVSPLRITIQGAAGYPDESWCVNISANSGTIAWTQFKQSCWASYGSYYDGKIPLQSVMFEVPGINSVRVNYDFCVGSVGPI